MIEMCVLCGAAITLEEVDGGLTQWLGEEEFGEAGYCHLECLERAED